MAKGSGGTRTKRPTRASYTNIKRQKAQEKKAESKMHYQNITAIDRTSLSTFAKTLPQHIKDMINVDISKAVVQVRRKLGGYIDVNFSKLKPNEEKAVKSYLTKLGYSYEENGAVNTAINFKHGYKGK